MARKTVGERGERNRWKRERMSERIGGRERERERGKVFGRFWIFTNSCEGEEIVWNFGALQVSNLINHYAPGASYSMYIS
jgi:hypothetical protein